ncbi:MAG TPA: glycosyltransferase family 2 protein [Gemmatimonadales bacterium]|nr:glycosyltransferase family 2 protein [Gemmatimonadales bacterium]
MSPTIVSVVIPCYNEEGTLRETHRRVRQSISRFSGYEFEIVYVDDGSADATPALLRDLQADDPHVRVVYLARNFGHQFAVSAGLAHATGDAVAIMDADLQDPPEVIGEMLERWRQGFEVVYGVRVDREGETRFKLWTASLFYRLINRLSDTNIPLDTGDFRLLDRKVVDAIVRMPERDRFLRGMVSWAGYRQTGVPYRRAARFAGETKYPLAKMVRFALDGIISFSVKPLRLSTLLGFLSAGIALVAIIYALGMRLFSQSWVTGWTALIIAILFLGGIQLISLGIIGEYIGRLYGEAKRRPLYLVRETLGFGQAPLSIPRFDEHPRTADRRSFRERRRAARDQRAQDGWRSVQRA